ncbi:hypothetical protein [Mesorhizobium sp. KR2-14]|uniref:hypothetical protein n=1 Tax=Mesorhizobium sp. KR2-14 TaxID=3156610 RepID=UPI0032B3F5AF
MSTKPDIEAIRDRLTAAVTASGRTVADIEAAAGLKRDGLRDFLARRKSGLTLVDARAVAAVLAISLEWLAGAGVVSS